MFTPPPYGHLPLLRGGLSPPSSKEGWPKAGVVF